ncbi:MAG: patatin-like phospholipase family protein, partial [Candidatus Omnitrophota bacterium]
MLKYKNIIIFFSLCLLASCISPAGRKEELTNDFQTLMPSFRELSIHRPIKANAIFDGGGIKAIASVGALKAAEDNGFQFVRVAGTSSGSLVAALYAAGYTSEELLHILATTDFMQFLRYKKPTPLYLFLHLSELKKDLGYYSTDLLYEWVKELLEAKNVRYFKDLKIPLRVVVADVLNRRRVVFSTENNPDMLVADALRYSMSIPIFFIPVNFNLEDTHQQILLDGAIIESYPVDIFSDELNKSIPAFGFRLFDSEEEKCTHQVKDISDYIGQIIKTATAYHEKKEVAEIKS